MSVKSPSSATPAMQSLSRRAAGRRVPSLSANSESPSRGAQFPSRVAIAECTRRDRGVRTNHERRDVSACGNSGGAESLRIASRPSSGLSRLQIVHQCSRVHEPIPAALLTSEPAFVEQYTESRRLKPALLRCLSQGKGFRARRQCCQRLPIQQSARVKSLDGDRPVRGIEIDVDDAIRNIRNP